jgi:flagellar biosynthesis protein FlhA
MASVYPLPPMATAPPHAPDLTGGAESFAEEALVVSPHLPEGATINLTAPGTPVVRRLADSLRRLIPAATAAALPVLLCPCPARYHVKRRLEPVMPRLAVVATREIPP